MSWLQEQGTQRSEKQRMNAIAGTTLVIGIILGLTGSELMPRSAAAAGTLSVDSLHVLRPDSACMTLVRRHVSDMQLMPESMRKDTSTMWWQAQRCAYVEDEKRRRRYREVATPTILELATLHFRIPEYHDEQRLKATRVLTDSSLGPAAGIFASPFLGELSSRKQIRAHGDTGMLVGFVVVLDEGGESLPENYRRLGLTWGMNCIWLAVDANLANLRAFASHAPPDSSCRAALRMPGATRTPLRVAATPMPPDSSIGAARFTEDVLGNPMLGFPCYDRWCDIGPSDAAAPRTVPTALRVRPSYAVGNYQRRETMVKGWFDEQRLEVNTPLGWVQTSVRGYLVPRRGINRIRAETYATPQHVADIYLDRTPPAGNKFINTLRAGWNKVELVNEAPAGAHPRFKYLFTPAGAAAPSYEAFVIQPMHDHWDAPVPGSTRWRFTLVDPGAWAPCGDNSCCNSGGT